MKLICGDALEELRKLDPDSMDALVTDPPAGISFMGKAWDGDKGGRDAWIGWLSEIFDECSRVLKPGAHALVWALPRMSHWTATALEDAGFEVRDVVVHLFGSGFPKSLDVSKAIDKSEGHWRGRAGAITIQSQPSKGQEYERTPKEPPVTDAAAAWDGRGTALKPASEHWILARKPCSEPTVAGNVLKWGTGAINVDGCRILTPDELNGSAYSEEGIRKSSSYKLGNTGKNYEQPIGRWPANVVLDPEAGRMLDEQSGESKSTGGSGERSGLIDNPSIYGNFSGESKGSNAGGLDDSGGASRFFYCPKPSRAERNDGLDGFEEKPVHWSSGDQNPGTFQAEGTKREIRNYHPTVKAVELMRYLCRLITPPAGTVLDPFMGTGSTGIGAHEEGLRFVGIEKEAGYFKIAQGRLKAATAQQRLFAERG